MARIVPPRWGSVHFLPGPRAALVPPSTSSGPSARLPWAGLSLGLWPANYGLTFNHALGFRRDALHLKRPAIIRRIIARADRAIVHRAVARVGPGTDDCVQLARPFKLDHAGLLPSRGLRVQHDAVTRRQAVPCRVKIRAEIWTAAVQFCQDAAQTSTAAGMARARPSARVGAFVMEPFHVHAGGFGETLTVARTPGDERERQAEGCAEKVHHVWDDYRLTPEALAGKWSAAMEGCD